MTKTIGLIGVPSSAGAHWPGQEKAPLYLRQAALVERLQSAGATVVDHGDLPTVRFWPDKAHPKQQNLSRVVDVITQTANQVHTALQQHETPLVIGGDCTITLGVITGFLRHGSDIGLLYFDAHCDLNTPPNSTSGILDSMGLAHMVAEKGAAEALSHVGPRFPLMPEDKIVMFGYSPLEMTPAEQEAFKRHSLHAYSVAQIQERVREIATEALRHIEACAGQFLVHFDVDVIDFVDFPIADVPQFNRGLTFREAMTCLEVFVASPQFAGLTLTEINPDHLDERGSLATAFVDGLVRVLAAAGVS